MKSPLKSDTYLLQLSSNEGNRVGLGSPIFLKQEDFVFDAQFLGHYPFSLNEIATSDENLDPTWCQHSSSNLIKAKFSQKYHEWDDFGYFDCINDSSTASSTAPLLLERTKRVQWKLDNLGNIVSEEYEPTETTFAVIRQQWYDANIFRQMRADCQRLSLQASVDHQYTATVREHLKCCQVGERPNLVHDEVLLFSRYRGLERSIFRLELQAAKFRIIHTIVSRQSKFGDNISYPDNEDEEEELAETSRRCTFRARHMARTLAIQDRIIADEIYNEERNSPQRKTIEI